LIPTAELLCGFFPGLLPARCQPFRTGAQCCFFALPIGAAALALGSDTVLLSHGIVYRLKPGETQCELRPGEFFRQQSPNRSCVCARVTVKTAGRMARRESALFTVTPKSVSSLAIVFLALAAAFGFLNSQKVKTLRATAASAQAAHDAAQRRSRESPRASTDGRARAEQTKKPGRAEDRAAKAEADLAKVQKENADLRAKLDGDQQAIASLQKRVEEAEKNASASAGRAAGANTPQRAELQSQIDDLRRQLDTAEKEKVFLSEKLQSAQEHAAQLQQEKRRKEQAPTSRKTGLRGTVLAVNEAYNFVVLNLGARQGVEPNAEMLVLRDGTLIGKIRISTVEPATAIGDIITSTLARGVQVQAGDIVIYAGTNP
jgi:predicted  nucleic acid-binding Zn-ribbon protein